MYASAGYDFIALTDHWVSSAVRTRQSPDPLLLIDGIELDGYDEAGSYYHVVCLGTTMDIKRENGFEQGLASARIQGALLVLAHPHWCGNTFDEATRWQFNGVEVYNHVCHFLNGKSSGAVHWNAMLKVNPGTLAFAVDDAHLRPEHPTWNGGWVMVNSPVLKQESLMDALRRGNFYASCGPVIEAMEFDGTALHVQMSPARYVRLVGPASRGQRLGTPDGALMTSAELVVPQDWDYVYLEIEDAAGRLAWTNTLFV